MDVRDLERRTGTALVYGVVVLAALFAPWPTFAILVAILAVLGYLELRALFRYRSFRPWLVGAVFVVLFIVAHMYGSSSPSELTVLTGALVAAFGARIGRRKIAPRISPGKTWEGTLAGFGAAAVVVLLIAASAGIKTGPTLLLAVLVGP